MSASTVLRFLGATGAVTGSKFLLTTPSSQVLVDCGLYQGTRELREQNWEQLPIVPDELDAVVLTHAHVDHCGYVPRLVAAGYRGPVFATAGTVDLARIVLPDCGHLNEEEAEYRSRHGASRHRPPLPLYTEADAIAATAQLCPVGFSDAIAVAPGVELRLHPAGHILGAASAQLDVAGGPVLVVSGDLGRQNHPILRGPAPPPAADAIVVESTYGDRRHPSDDGGAALGDAIDRTIRRGGSVLIPAFAVDRTEVVLHQLTRLVRRGRLAADVPVYVDSPMALAALGAYRAALERGDRDLRDDVHDLADVIDLPNLHEVHDVEGSKALNDPRRPSIIISAAGMASGGRVVHHLAHLLPDPRHSVLLVGYQAVGTRGRALLDGARDLRILGRYVKVRAEIVDLPVFSVHADADELLAWVSQAPREPGAVYVVHGEPAGSAALADAISRRLDWTAVVPHHLERVLVEAG